VSLSQYIRLIWTHRLLVVLAVAATTAAAATLAWTRTPIYEAHIQVLVSSGAGGQGLDETYQAGLVAQQRAPSYAALVSSPAVSDAVIDDLRLPYTTQELQARTDASVKVNSVLIDVAARDPSADRARDIADAVGRQLPRVAASLEEGPADQAAKGVTLQALGSADRPTAPVSPRRPVYLAFGVLLGLVLGVAGALLRERVAGRVRTEDDVAATVGAPVLGTVTASGPARGSRNGSHPPLSGSEEYRQLRTALSRPGSASGRCLIVTSAGSGEGKTSVAANLAVAFAEAERRVVLVDANVRRPRVARLFGLDDSPGLTDVLGGLPLPDALRQLPGTATAGVLPRGSDVARAGDRLFSLAAAALLADVKARADVVIIDAAAVLEAADVLALAPLAPSVLLVARLGSTRVRELEAATEQLRHVRANVVGVVVNDHRTARGVST
jgi:polysaccharide biosynthesis transport protein